MVSRDETESLFCVILFLLYAYGYVLDHNDLKMNTVDVVVLVGFFLLFSFLLLFCTVLNEIFKILHYDNLHPVLA